MHGVLVKKTGEEQAEQILGDAGDGALGGQVFAVQMVDATHAGVGGDKLVGELSDSFHSEDLPQNPGGTKAKWFGGGQNQGRGFDRKHSVAEPQLRGKNAKGRGI